MRKAKAGSEKIDSEAFQKHRAKLVEQGTGGSGTDTIDLLSPTD